MLGTSFEKRGAIAFTLDELSNLTADSRLVTCSKQKNTKYLNEKIKDNKNIYPYIAEINGRDPNDISSLLRISQVPNCT